MPKHRDNDIDVTVKLKDLDAVRELMAHAKKLEQERDELQKQVNENLEGVRQFNLGWEAAKAGKSELDEPTFEIGQDHDQWRCGFAWFAWDDIKKERDDLRIIIDNEQAQNSVDFEMVQWERDELQGQLAAVITGLEFMRSVREAMQGERDRLTMEVARLRLLVRIAYDEGADDWTDQCSDDTVQVQRGKDRSWAKSETRKALAINADLDTGIAACQERAEALKRKRKPERRVIGERDCHPTTELFDQIQDLNPDPNDLYHITPAMFSKMQELGKDVPDPACDEDDDL